MPIQSILADYKYTVPALQAGGHWFKSSSAHSKTPISQTAGISYVAPGGTGGYRRV